MTIMVLPALQMGFITGQRTFISVSSRQTHGLVVCRALGSTPMVVLQHAAESLTAILDGLASGSIIAWLNQFVLPSPLMVSFGMVMLHAFTTAFSATSWPKKLRHPVEHSVFRLRNHRPCTRSCWAIFGGSRTTSVSVFLLDVPRIGMKLLSRSHQMTGVPQEPIFRSRPIASRSV